ncbi:hypothetical protein ACG94V_15370 [Acinetobacter sp. ULE_I001]|uniref:hypothetical protein n=1 Tax=unclassified Acinetobacter TaxID=196816 RepID=UPI003AF8B02A
MAFYTVTYDLNKNKDYERFAKGIVEVSSGKFVKATLSQYIIQSYLTPAQIRIVLQTFADSDDSILVLKLDVSDWSCCNLSQELINWLQIATNVGN